MAVNGRRHPSLQRSAVLVAALIASQFAAPGTPRAQSSGLLEVTSPCVPPPVPREADGWPIAVTDDLGTVTRASITFSGATLLDDDKGASLSIVSVGPASSGNGAVTGTDPYTFTFASGFNGTDIFPYEISDKDGRTAVGLVRVRATGDTVVPAVSITEPAAGATLSGSVLVKASATDNVGITAVRFFDGATPIGPEISAAPFQATWDTTGAADGTHNLTAVAQDAAGNTTTSAVLAVLVSNGGTPPDPASGLVLALSFDEASGDTVSDTSGRGNAGTISGATRTAAGRFGGALSFDGVDDWVTIADAASLDLTSGMTLEAWVKTSALTGWRTTILKETTAGLAYALYANDDVPRPAAYVNLGGADQSTAGTSPLSPDWTHLATTFDGATLRLYVNGTLASAVTTAGQIITSAGALRIGGNSVWGEYFDGLIDEVRVYTRALSVEEIAADMNTAIDGGAPATAGPVLALAFDEAAGATATDASGHGNDGTLAGATRTTAGRFGAALSFNGVSDAVTVADAASLDLTSGMTLEAWVKPSAASDWRTAILKETAGGLAYALYASTDTSVPGAYLNLGAADQSVAGSGALSTADWTHLAATFDGDTLRLYVNGALANSFPVSGAIVQSGGALRIGGNAVWGEFFAGVIDEVRVYDRALTAAEIVADMNAPIGQ